MKTMKWNLYSMALLAGLSFFTACSDDDNNGVVDHLFFRRPDNLFQLALHIAEVAADSCGDTLLRTGFAFVLF